MHSASRGDRLGRACRFHELRSDLRSPAGRGPTRLRRALVAAAGLALGAACAACGSAPLGGRAARGQEAFVVNGATAPAPTNTVVPVDLVRHRVDPAITVGIEPAAMAITPEGSSLLVVSKGVDTLSAVSLATTSVTWTTRVGLEPDAVAVTPDGRTAVVANYGDGTISLVDLRSHRVRATVHVGAQPVAVAVTPDGARAVVANFGDATASVVSLRSRSVVATIDVGAEDDAVAVTPDGATALVGCFGDNTVVPINLATLQPGAPVTIPGGPRSIAIATGQTSAPAVTGSEPAGSAASRAGRAAYVASGNSLWPVALPGLVVGNPIIVGHPAEGVALGPDHRYAYVATADGYLVPVDLAKGIADKPIFVGGKPYAVVVAR